MEFDFWKRELHSRITSRSQHNNQNVSRLKFKSCRSTLRIIRTQANLLPTTTLLVAVLFVIFNNYTSSHIVLTRDERGSSLILTGSDGGKGGKGGKGGGGDRVVISGSNMGGDGQSSNMIMEDASNKEGDIVMNGNSMIVPGEDGHIVLADGRNRGGDGNGPQPPPPNLLALWMPYMNSRMSRNPYRMMMPFPFAFGR